MQGKNKDTNDHRKVEDKFIVLVGVTMFVKILQADILIAAGHLTADTEQGGYGIGVIMPEKLLVGYKSPIVTCRRTNEAKVVLVGGEAAPKKLEGAATTGTRQLDKRWRRSFGGTNA